MRCASGVAVNRFFTLQNLIRYQKTQRKSTVDFRAGQAQSGFFVTSSLLANRKLLSGRHPEPSGSVLLCCGPGATPDSNNDTRLLASKNDLKYRMTVFPYFESAPHGFAESADTVLEVEDQRLPAHSQFLASQSRFMSNMLKDLGSSLSRAEQIVVPAAMLSSFKVQDVVHFLSHVYNFCNEKPQSAEEAYQVFRLADLFDSPKLMKVCVDYLGAQPNGMLKPTIEESGALKWALLSEQYALQELQDQSIAFIAQNFDVLQYDTRLGQLSRESLLKLGHQLQAVIAERSRLHRAELSSSSMPCQGIPPGARSSYGYCSKNSCRGGHFYTYFEG